jgi:hypothetical protein
MKIVCVVVYYNDTFGELCTSTMHICIYISTAALEGVTWYCVLY